MPLDQVMDILAVDLGIALQRSDEIELAKSYADNSSPMALAIDVHRLLDSVALWHSGDDGPFTKEDEEEMKRRHRLHQKEQQRNRTGSATANLR